MTADVLFAELLRKRGYDTPDAQAKFLQPDYQAGSHDPWLLPDMQPAVQRLIEAKVKNERVVIYGDYDIDGLTATTLLREAFLCFGLQVETFIPNRFIEGYGLSSDAVRQLADAGHDLIVTVDCGSLSHAEIALAGELGMQVIVTDHHSVAETMPPAVATINPKRPDHSYPFIDLPGVGVAFKLVQALQQKLPGLPLGHEKWLLDLVAMGTVCDVVSLVDENRMHVYWGLQVLAKTRRHGLRALAEVAEIDISAINARHLGYVLGPHLNASGRLDTAQTSLDLFMAADRAAAEPIAQKLRTMNRQRRADQDAIFAAAIVQAEQFADLPVMVLSAPGWSHGIIGIVAAKILERTKKPTFILQEMENGIAKGSARSYGDFSAVEAINFARPLLEKGGGHKLAAGVTLKVENIPAFRKAVNDFYHSQNLQNQAAHLAAVADAELPDFTGLDFALIELLGRLEPFGNSNPEPIFRVANVQLAEARAVGADGSHLKVAARDPKGQVLKGIGFSLGEYAGISADQLVTLTFKLMINEWNGRKTVEMQVLEINTQ